jgi:hypothetical protein
MLPHFFAGKGSPSRWRRLVTGLLTALVLVPVPMIALSQTVLDEINKERRDLRNFNRQQNINFGTQVSNAQRRDGAWAEILAYTRFNWTNLNSIQRTELFLGTRVTVIVVQDFTPFTFTGRFRNMDP